MWCWKMEEFIQPVNCLKNGNLFFKLKSFYRVISHALWLIPVLIVFGLLAIVPIIRDNILLFYSVSGSRGLISSLEMIFALLVFCFVRDNIAIPRSLYLAFLLWIVSLLISLALSDHFVFSLVRGVELVCHILFALAILVLIKKYSFFYKVVFVFNIISFLLLFIFLLVVWIYSDANIRANFVNSVPGFRNIRFFCHYIVFFSVFSGSLFFLNSRAWHLISFLLLTMGWMIIFWSGGRGALLSLLASGIIISLLIKSGRIKFLLFLCASCVVGFLSFTTFFSDAKGSLGVHKIVRDYNVVHHKGIQSLNRISSNRIEIWQDTLSYINEKKWFGYGPDGYVFLDPVPGDYPGFHPHNVILQLMIEFGLVGCLCFFFFLGKIIITASMKLRNEKNLFWGQIAGLWLLIAYFILGQVSSTFYYPLPLMFLSLSLAMALYKVDFPNEIMIKFSSKKLLAVCVAGLLIMGLHLSVHYWQFTGLSPHSWQLHVVKYFPSSLGNFKGTLTEWLENGNREAVIEWSRWAQHHVINPKAYYELEQRALVEGQR